MHYATTDDQNTIIVVWVPVLHFIYLWKKKKKAPAPRGYSKHETSNQESEEVIV